MLAALDHPNIAKFHTAMRVGNQLLMFMEFVDGISLAKKMESGPVPSAEAAAISAQVLDALSYAHSQGVVHRDIKPANIMLTGAGEVKVAKLMDFGIARMQSDKRLTQTGAAVGSLFYMSPEQISGAEPDPRSDLYSLGITLYEMVTGRRPFAGDSDYQIMSAHLQQAPQPPIEIVPGVPPDLSEIILTAIAKEPVARFQSAAAFRAALLTVFPGASTLRAGANFATKTMPPRAVPPPPPPPVFAAPPPVPPRVPGSAPAAGPPPVPPPLPRPPQVVPVPPVVAQKSHRGLYMAAGSVATLALLIAAGIEGPKLLHRGSSAASEAVTPAASATPPAPATSADPATPATPDNPASAPAASATTQPSNPPQPATTGSGWKPVGQSPAATTSPAQAAAPPVNAAPAPQQQAPQQPAQQSAAPQQNAPPPAQSQSPPAPAPNREAAQLRQQFNELTIRANTAGSGLRSFEQQQSRQGLGLRADIREAKTRLDYQLQEAASAIQNGDPESARQSLRYAQSAIETIEKFLGR